MDIKPKTKREKIIFWLLHYIELTGEELSGITDLTPRQVSDAVHNIRACYGINILKEQCSTRVTYRIDNFEDSLSVYQKRIEERHIRELRELKALQMTYETSFSYRKIAERCRLSKDHVYKIIKQHHKNLLF